MLLLVVILLTVIRSSYQVVYSCDPKVVCGCSSKPASITRIVGGENAGTATWGWAVSISIDDNYLCGGSIISSSWIITAAHCVEGHKALQITIYAGSTRRWSGTQIQVASRVIIHPKYNSDTNTNDIALLQLITPLIMSDSNVSPICIPSINSSILASSEWPPAGTTVVAIGWGRFSEDGDIATTLQQVTLTIVDDRASTCRPLIDDQHTQLCAGANGKDTCQGDSGGPLMMFTSSNQWILVGITSFGKGCARPTYSGVYTRVADYENWIRSNTNDSYWSVVFSPANLMQTSVYYLLFFVLFIFLVKFHS